MRFIVVDFNHNQMYINVEKIIRFYFSEALNGVVIHLSDGSELTVNISLSEFIKKLTAETE